MRQETEGHERDDDDDDEEEDDGDDDDDELKSPSDLLPHPVTTQSVRPSGSKSPTQTLKKFCKQVFPLQLHSAHHVDVLLPPGAPHQPQEGDVVDQGGVVEVRVDLQGKGTLDEDQKVMLCLMVLVIGQGKKSLTMMSTLRTR